LDGALYLCQIADSVADLMTPRALPPVIDSLDRAPSGDYTVSWRPQNPEAGVDFYRLDELNGLSVATDDAEGDGASWSLEGFSISDARSHGPGHSYRSSSQTANAYDAMTTIYPYIVAPGDSLTFWCWYDIEENYDMAYAEISTDGRRFSLLDTAATFTAASGAWVRKAYSLLGYAGQSVYFRFRHTADGETEREGFYLDDITPVATYANSTILSVSIADTFYAIAGRSPGTYTYRVKGHNDARGWGDWSGYREVIVGPALPRRISDLTAELSGGLRLIWSPVTFDTEGQLISIDHYVVHRDTSFAFAVSPANSLAVTDQAMYEDFSIHSGDPSIDHYYLVRAVDGQGNKSQNSNRVGEFDRYLTRVK
jgi:hypothetical protein